MALLAISATPRKGGNSEQVLNSFAGGASTAGRETETIRLNDLNFRPCQACGLCAATGKCVLQNVYRPLPMLVVCQIQAEKTLYT
ncbi:MAG: flavodoxin family protein [Dethiobacteria bacterium]